MYNKLLRLKDFLAKITTMPRLLKQTESEKKKKVKIKSKKCIMITNTEREKKKLPQ